MRYVGLFRGINVGGNNIVDMKRLKAVFESLGLKDVSTYINSGNIIFESKKSVPALKRIVTLAMKKEFGFSPGVLIKTEKEIKAIAKAIPKSWRNDEVQRTDVAYLFKEADSKRVLKELPFAKGYIDVRYVKGALIWNLKRKHLNKSRLNKVVGSNFYQQMTIRNVNTAQYLSSLK